MEEQNKIIPVKASPHTAQPKLLFEEFRYTGPKPKPAHNIK
jgi:hypothetical protein